MAAIKVTHERGYHFRTALSAAYADQELRTHWIRLIAEDGVDKKETIEVKEHKQEIAKQKGELARLENALSGDRSRTPRGGQLTLDLYSWRFQPHLK